MNGEWRMWNGEKSNSEAVRAVTANPILHSAFPISYSSSIS